MPSDDGGDTGGGQQGGRIKYVVGNVPVYVVAERVQYYGPDGKLITESLRDYTRSCVTKQFGSSAWGLPVNVTSTLPRCWSKKLWPKRLGKLAGLVAPAARPDYLHHVHRASPVQYFDISSC